MERREPSMDEHRLRDGIDTDADPGLLQRGGQRWQVDATAIREQGDAWRQARARGKAESAEHADLFTTDIGDRAGNAERCGGQRHRSEPEGSAFFDRRKNRYGTDLPGR